MYDPNWELNSHEAMMMLYGREWSGDMKSKLYCNQSTPKSFSSSILSMLLHLRSSEDFSIVHISGARSMPIASLTPATVSPFDDVKVLDMKWRDLKHTMSGPEFLGMDIVSSPLIVVCYHGETARLACSI